MLEKESRCSGRGVLNGDDEKECRDHAKEESESTSGVHEGFYRDDLFL